MKEFTLHERLEDDRLPVNHWTIEGFVDSVQFNSTSREFRLLIPANDACSYAASFEDWESSNAPAILCRVLNPALWPASLAPRSRVLVSGSYQNHTTDEYCEPVLVIEAMEDEWAGA